MPSPKTEGVHVAYSIHQADDKPTTVPQPKVEQVFSTKIAALEFAVDEGLKYVLLPFGMPLNDAIRLQAERKRGASSGLPRVVADARIPAERKVK